LQVAKVPSNRIVILGQSLGTGVTAGVVECFAKRGIDFAGVVLVAGFTTMPNLLTEYSIAGYIPLLSPLKLYPVLQKYLTSYVVDTWQSAPRLANIIRLSKKIRLFIIHAKNDYEIPWTQSEGLFAAAANATTDGGMDVVLFKKMKVRSTIDMGDGAFISTWKVSENKIIRQEILAYGRKLSNPIPSSICSFS
jgi:abhydrolase domain-containing protein 12